MRKSTMWILLLAFVLNAAMAFALSTGAGVSADQALQKLKEGNARFVSGKMQHPNMDAARRDDTTKNGQHPFASVLSCSDSRVPPELLFDQGVGDVFVIRVAGNVAATDEIGSIEYGAEHLGAQLVLVLGHTKCGAVTAVVKGEEVHGSIPTLVKPIVPALETVLKANPGTPRAELVEKTIVQNIWRAVADLWTGSPMLRDFARQGKLKVVGALYHIDSGQVDFLGAHPEEAKLLVK
jgi:carbonic anhydrase